MSDNVKIALLWVSGLGCVLAFVSGELIPSDTLMNLGYAFGGVFGLTAGFPKFMQGVSKLVKEK